MNTGLSLGIFNMLEAFLLFYIVHLLRNNFKHVKFNFVSNIKHFYILGAINYIFQCLPYRWIGTFDYISTNIKITFIVLPIILCIYCKFIGYKTYWLKLLFQTFIAHVYNNVTILLSLFIIEPFVERICFGQHNQTHIEIIENIIIKIIQFSILFIVIGVNKIYEKNDKEFCKK